MLYVPDFQRALSSEADPSGMEARDTSKLVYIAHSIILMQVCYKKQTNKNLKGSRDPSYKKGNKDKDLGTREILA